MKRKKNKGFSLIELLATMSILAVLSITIIVSTKHLRVKARDNHYETQVNNIIFAAQAYSSDSSVNVPKNIGQKTTIPLKRLIDNNYIDSVRDYTKKACNVDKSYVEIFNSENGLIVISGPNLYFASDCVS